VMLGVVAVALGEERVVRVLRSWVRRQRI